MTLLRSVEEPLVKLKLMGFVEMKPATTQDHIPEVWFRIKSLFRKLWRLKDGPST